MPIESVPKTFAVTDSTIDLTFAIPAGSYSAAEWSVTGLWLGIGTSSMTTNGHGVQIGAHSSNGNYTDTKAASADQLADINAAAGGDLIATFGRVGGSQSVTSCTLTLTLSGGGPLDDFIYPSRLVIDFEARGAQVRSERNITPERLVIAWTLKEPTLQKGTTARSLPVDRLLIGWSLPEPSFYSSEPEIVKQGDLRFRQGRDMEGDTWTTEVVIATGADAGVGGAWFGDGYGALYGVSADLKWERAANPGDWTGTVTPITTPGKAVIRAFGQNRNGTLLAYLSTGMWGSRDQGVTWTQVGAPGNLAANYPTRMIAIGHLFILLQVDGSRVRHWVSEDEGMTWK